MVLITEILFPLDGFYDKFDEALDIAIKKYSTIQKDEI
jgi:hypothetical protein